MKKYSLSKRGSSVRNSTDKKANGNNITNRVIDWEVRPGGMLVQKRESGDGDESSSGSSGLVMINIKVSHASYLHDFTLPAHYTFGDLKRVLANETGLQPKEQRLLFRGKEKEDGDCLDMSGVKDMSKIILLEDPASKERKIEAMKKNRGLSRAYEAVAQVRVEVDKLSHKVVALQTMMSGGGDARLADKDFVALIESLMTQLLKLDTIEAEGEARAQRRIEVRRVQSFVDVVDELRARNSSPLSRIKGNAVGVSTRWETFESGLGSLCAPIPRPVKCATKITQEWEQFE